MRPGALEARASTYTIVYWHYPNVKWSIEKLFHKIAKYTHACSQGYVTINSVRFSQESRKPWTGESVRWI